MKRLALAAVLFSSGALATPIKVWFEGKAHRVENDKLDAATIGDTEFVPTVIDFEACTLSVAGKDAIKGSKCDKGYFSLVETSYMGPMPITYQVWVYASPNGSYVLTYQEAHGWHTSVFRGNSYNVER